MASGFRLVAAVSLVLAASVAIGMAHAGEPIPGVDVKLGKNPGGQVIVVATTDREGRFSAQVRVEPGEYAVTTACAPRRPCRPNRLLTQSVDSREVRPDAPGRLPVSGRREPRHGDAQRTGRDARSGFDTAIAGRIIASDPKSWRDRDETVRRHRRRPAAGRVRRPC